MCGILVYSKASDITEKLIPFIRKRGPDYFGTLSQGYTFHSSVLGLREPFTIQPIERGKSVLCYNGQIYGIEGNDTLYVYEQLIADGPLNGLKNILKLNGEFSLVYFDGTDLFFARDSIGKRSLLYCVYGDDIVVSSVGLPGFVECEAGVVYKWNQQLTQLTWKSTISPQKELLPPNNDAILKVLTAAVQDRMVLPSSQTSVAVLFSGGLDCTILARLMDLVLPENISIELLNVAFENKRTGAKFDTPDRKLAIRSQTELSQLSKRDIKLIKIDVPYDVAISYYERVSLLMYPKSTVMDLSIALAFYCASKATQETKSRILISGLGADELFGGYSRHTRAAEQGRETLAAELELDFNRLGERNLGRDDRVCGDSGREVRYPFLDYRVVEAAMVTDLELKASPNDTKILLRQIARSLGLNEVCSEKKRAIQFGAKSAKMDPGSGRAKGTDLL